MKQKALFIVNPVSGGKRKDDLPELIEKYVDKDKFDLSIAFSNHVSHANELAADAGNKFDVVVAVGGDGTVNEVASAIVGTQSRLGIIPCGSGNGLARFLGIPMDVEQAIKNINKEDTEVIDSACFNGQPFFNMAGMGFDAHISELFSHDKTRGFISYVKTSLKEISTYKSQIYKIIIDGTEYEREAFMLSFANSSQYGNNAHVSPKASVQDGLIDVCIIKPFPLYRFPEMGLRMFTKTADGSKFVEIIRGKNVRVIREKAGPIHLDGEPQIAGIEADIKVLPGSLKIIVGNSFKV